MPLEFVQTNNSLQQQQLLPLTKSGESPKERNRNSHSAVLVPLTMDSNTTVSNGTGEGGRFMSPEELAMQSLTKQLYKSRLFRGFYMERCFVEQIGGYRDIIALQRGERELEKLLLKSAGQMQLFYQRFVPHMWIGITKSRKSLPPGQLETCIWTELNDLAFGEYWFSIKTLRFRDHEVQLKLKMVRAVEPEPEPPRRSLSLTKGNSSSRLALTQGEETIPEPQIGMEDFIKVLQQWGKGIKQTTYDFMANDVNKHNIMSAIRFVILLLVSLVGGVAMSLRFMGIFAVRFLFELSRFTHTATPIVFKLIEFINKLVGAFFILLTMIWKDLVVNRGGRAMPKPALEENTRFRSLTYGSHRRSSRLGSANFG